MGSIVRKTPDTALYSIYVSTLCFKVYTSPNDNLTFRVRSHAPSIQSHRGTKVV